MRYLLFIALFCLAGCATLSHTNKATNPACLFICKAEVNVPPPKENDNAP